jgi:hypothetical protein
MAAPATITNEDLNGYIAGLILTDEYDVSVRNMADRISIYDDVRDAYHCERPDKNYEWQSNLTLPKVAQTVINGASKLNDIFFSSRDYVRAVPHRKVSKQGAQAGESLLNAFLKNPELHYFLKSVRSEFCDSLYGWSVHKWHWEKDIEHRVVGSQIVPRVEMGMDGMPLLSLAQEPVYGKIIKKDFPQMEVFTPRTVYFSPERVDDFSKKRWVIFTAVEDIQALREQEEAMGYFNLDGLGHQTETDTETAQEREEETAEKSSSPLHEDVETFERWGKWPVRTEGEPQFDDDGVLVNPKLDVQDRPIPGIDKNGKVASKDVAWPEMWITCARSEGKKPTVIRWQINPYGFKTVSRGQLGIMDPDDDLSRGQGELALDFQTGICDNLNARNDATLIGMFPPIVTGKDMSHEWDTFRYGPSAIWMADTGGTAQDQLRELRINPNTADAANIHMLLDSELQRTTNEYAHTSGDFPGRREPATGYAVTSQAASLAYRFKAKVIEHTQLRNDYQIILRMAGKFMEPETPMSLIGEEAQFLDLSNPHLGFTPITQSLEPESSKQQNIQSLVQMIPMIMGIPNPNTITLVNHMVSEIFKLMGHEYEQYGDMLLNPAVPPQMMTPPGSPTAPQSAPMQNQMGGMQSGPEMMNRMAMTQMGAAA